MALTAEKLMENYPMYLAIGILSCFFSVALHEFFHAAVAIVNGCPASISSLNWVFGATAVGECPKSAVARIAVSAPILCFLASLAFWFGFGKNSDMRLFAIALMFWSTIPNMLPSQPGTDFYKAVAMGFPSPLAWFLFLGCLGLTFELLHFEIKERE